MCSDVMSFIEDMVQSNERIGSVMMATLADKGCQILPEWRCKIAVHRRTCHFD